MNILELSERAARDLGFTVKFADGSTPTRGFAVSLPGYERVIDSPHPVHIGQYLADLLPVWADVIEREAADTLHFGAWYNPEDERFYLDLSVVVPSESYARDLGKRWGQKAIFNLASKEGITL